MREENGAAKQLERIADTLERIAPDIMRIGATLDQCCHQDPADGRGYLRVADPAELLALAAASGSDEEPDLGPKERAADALEDLRDLFALSAHNSDLLLAEIDEKLGRIAAAQPETTQDAPAGKERAM